MPNEASRGAAFGPDLRRLREATGLTQEELAERAGLTPRAISALERGERRRPYPHTVRALAAALRLSPEQQAALVASARQAEASQPKPAVVRRPRLPVPPTSIIGRERELAELAALVCRERSRLVTLTGPGGVGKTRLALELARQVDDDVADGVAFVPLAPLAGAELVLPAIGHALGVTGAGSQGIRVALHAHVRSRRLLLVLDNVEHVLDAAPDVADLLAAGPGLAIVATSRAPLRLRGEREYPVSPLAVPGLERAARLEDVADDPAVRLYVARARDASPAFALTPANAGAVAAICRRLDGLPLALELAAARTKVLPPAALLARLDRSSLPLLTGGPRDLPARQQTMEAAIGWSYDLLTPEEQALFRRLSVFAGGFTLEAAEAVGAGYPLGGGEGAEPAPSPSAPSPLPAVLDVLSSLVDKSLVFQVPGPDSEPRFGMLETIREYGVRALAETGEAEASRRRHAGWYLTLAERAEPELLGPRQGLRHDRLEGDLDNLRAAFGWAVEAGDRTAAVRLAGALWPFWFTRGNPTEGRRWLEQAVAWAGAMPAPLRLKALSGAGMLAMAQQDFGRAIALLEPAHGIAVAIDDRAAAGRALFGLGVAAQDEGDPVSAEVRFEAALAAFEAADDALWAATTLNNLGLVVARRGDPDRGAQLLERGLERHRSLGYAMGESLALRFLGQVARQRGDDARAADLFRQSLVDWPSAQGWHVANALEGLASIAAEHGQPEQAIRLFGAGMAVREAIGVPLEPALRPAYERTLEALRTALGEGSFDCAWAAGMRDGIARAVADAATVGPKALSAPAVAAPSDHAAGAGLTKREQEVMRVMVAGRTANREIAEALSISPRTAGTHVAAILAKLGVGNRAAAVAAALQRRLV